MSKSRIETVLRRDGLHRRLTSLAVNIVAALRTPQLRQEFLLEQAMRVETLALLAVLDAVCDSVDQLFAAPAEAFGQHPDYEIITSFPGLADISGAIVLAEIGAGSAEINTAPMDDISVPVRRTFIQLPEPSYFANLSSLKLVVKRR